MKRKFDSTGVEDSDGVAWHRGIFLGKGGFGSVYLAELKNPNSRNGYFPELMAIKSAEISDSSSLQKEKEVLCNLRNSPYILDCYGEETTTTKNGHMIYNVLLEYASGGTLGGLIKRSGGPGLPELDVRRYTRCILKGIDYIHNHGYVHCDLKPDNVLLVSDENWESFDPKIGDFGLAKRSLRGKKMKFDPNIGGTALYMAPETVIDRIQEPPCDIWALGCIVYEMLTGKKVWNPKPNMSSEDILEKISDPCELPKILPNISEEGKGFLKGCLVRNPVFRFTAGMLLIHPFVSGILDEVEESLDEERADDDDHELCTDSSFTCEDGFTYLSSSRPDDGINIERRMFDNNLLDFRYRFCSWNSRFWGRYL